MSTIKSVAKITPELADEIRGTTPEGAFAEFNPTIDGNGNTIVTFPLAQYLYPDQFETILFVAPAPPEDL